MIVPTTPSAPTGRPLDRLDGGTRTDLPLLVVGPSLGTSSRNLWGAVARALRGRAVVVGWDPPGHGGRPGAGHLTAPGLAADLAAFGTALAAELGRERFAYAGNSLGGLIGLQLALDAPTAVSAVGVLCSAPRIGDPATWAQRAAAVRAAGTAPLRGSSRERWFAPDSAAAPAAVEALLDDLEATDDASYAACCDLLASTDLRGDLGRLTVPVLVAGGNDDVVVPPADVLALGTVPGVLATTVPGAGHQLPVEEPRRVAELLDRHVLQAPAAAPATLGSLYADGLAVRREVLGGAHVDRATLAADGTSAQFQELITRYAWGSVWTRPGLTRRERSMITLTALIARGHHEELAMHLRAAVRNGLTPAEVDEVLLQSAIYCGVPDANTAFRILREVRAENPEETE